MKKLLLLTLTLLGSTVAQAQNGTETAVLTNNVQFTWSTNQAIALKACWRDSIVGTTNALPVFNVWAAAAMKEEMIAVAQKWEDQRSYRAAAAKADLLARLAKCEPTSSDWVIISNLIVAAEARQ